MSQAQDNVSDQSLMIVNMERKLNASWFSRRTEKDKFCKISTTQFWDWLVYVDVSCHTQLRVLQIGRLPE